MSVRRKASRIKSVAASIALALLVAYLAALGVVYFGQRSLLFLPPLVAEGMRAGDTDPALRDFTARTDDGLDVRGWYAPATHKPLTLVYFHGNALDIAASAWLAKPFAAAGYGFLLAEYRGYSGLAGQPTEMGLYADARAYLRQLIASGVPEDHIVLFGYSLGTGVAVQMAAEFHVAGLILAAPYLSIPKVAQLRYPIFPALWLTRDRFESDRKIAGLHAPLFLVNNADDKVVPAAHGRQLFALAHEPKEAYFAPSGGHGNVFDPPFFDMALAWLGTLPPLAADERAAGSRTR